MSRISGVGVAYASAAGALWGFSFIGPLLLTDAPPMLVAAGRYAAYGFASLIAMAALRSLRQAGSGWRDALVLTLLGNLLYFVCLSAALQRAGVVLPTLIIGMLPVTIPLAACALERRRPNGYQLGGFGLTIAGTWLAHPQPVGGYVAPDVAGGVLLAVLALGLWTAYALSNARLLKHHHGISGQTWSGMQGATSLPFALALGAIGGQAAFATLDWSRFLIVSLVMGLFGSLLANSLWNAASRHLQAAQLGPMIVAETLAGLLYGRIWSGVPWPTQTWLGAALLVCGVLLAVRVDRPPPAPAPV
ncbi:MAG: DMT family transporter [Stagnimonas sp.]|nr:DMT family transporter [Stagnimonas sp.]